MKNQYILDLFVIGAFSINLSHIKKNGSKGIFLFNLEFKKNKFEFETRNHSIFVPFKLLLFNRDVCIPCKIKN